MLTEQAAQARRQYMKDYRERKQHKLNEYLRVWRKKNPEKVQQYNIRYWEKKARELKEQS